MKYRTILMTVALAGLLTACSDDSGTKTDGKVADMSHDMAVDMNTDTMPPDGPILVADKGPMEAGADTTAPDGAGPSNDKCATPQVLTYSGSPVTVQLDTTGATDDLNLPSATSCTGDETPGPDLFYQVQLPAGTYTITLAADPNVDPALYVLTSCLASACVDGSDVPFDGADEEIALTVASATTYIIGVDSYDSTVFGPATLTITAGTTTDAGPDGPVVDQGPAPDLGPTPDQGPAPDGVLDGTTTPPSVVITEILFDPTKVTDGNGEWFEVYNAGSAVVNLKDWTIKDKGSDMHKIATDVLIAPGAYAVLGNNATSATNGGVTVAYAYGSSWYLANTDDEILLYDPQNNLVDEVSYNKTQTWTMMTSGASLQLKGLTLDNNVATNWCASTVAWGSGTDFGSPNAANNCAP